jgi:PPM family protein phosphatase
MHLEWGAATHTGRVRRVNQDSLVTEPPVFAVADGMGGHAAGEVASAIAVDVMRATLGSSPTTVAQVVNAVRTANIEILRQALEDEARRGMGTTVSGVALVTDEGEEELAIVNVGDSRTYLFRGGELGQVTRDHTYVEDLVAAGEITAEAARSHPQRHILTRVLGVDPDIEVDLWIFTPAPGDRYLVCSDGLPNEVDEATMADILRGGGSAQEVCDDLVRLALDFGARDNVTVVVLDVLDGDGPDRASTDSASADSASADAASTDAASTVAAPAVPAEPAGDQNGPAGGQAAAVAAAAATAGALPAPPDGGSGSEALEAALRPMEPEAPPAESKPFPTPLPPPATPVGGWLGEHPFDVPDAPVPGESRPADVTAPVVHSLAEAEPTAVAPAPAEDPAAGPVTRRRRRRIGVATLVTLLALLVLGAVAVGGIVYYGRSGYFAGFTDDGSVAVFQGRPEGVLWVQPTVEIVYPLQREELAPEWQERIERTISFSSLDAADRWYQALSTNPNAVPGLATTTTTPTTAAPTTAAPTTAPAPAATTAVPGSGP